MNRTTFTTTLTAAVLAVLSAIPVHAAQGGALLPKADLNRDGVVDRGEVDQVRLQRFERLDLNADGYLDREEAARARTRPVVPGSVPPGATGREAGPGWAPGAPRGGGGKLFLRADRDGDGRVSRDEFMSLPHPGFDRADSNRDGRLTADELAALPARPCRMR